MARIRTIKPEFWTSEQVLDLSHGARLLFIGMWNFADDAGRFKWKPRMLRAQIFPGDDHVPAGRVAEWLDDLEAGGLIESYIVDGQRYGHMLGWHHQKICRPQPSKLPEPLPKSGEQPIPFPTDHGAFIDRSLSDHGAFTDHSPTEGKGREEEGKGSKTARALKPPSQTASPPREHDGNNTRAQFQNSIGEPEPPGADPQPPSPAAEAPLTPPDTREAMPVPLDDSRAVEPPCRPGNHASEPWLAVAKLYANRFLQATTRPVAVHLHKESWEAIVLESGGDMDLVEKSLSNYWGDEWAAEHRWPPKAWAKQFHRHLENSPKRRIKRRELTYPEEQLLERVWPRDWQARVEELGPDAAMEACRADGIKMRERMIERDRELAAKRAATKPVFDADGRLAFG